MFQISQAARAKKSRKNSPIEELAAWRSISQTSRFISQWKSSLIQQVDAKEQLKKR
jgi:hypothetical protein